MNGQLQTAFVFEEIFDPDAKILLKKHANDWTLLAIGFVKEPDKAYGGQFALSEIVHDEHFGRPWNDNGNEKRSSKEIIEKLNRKPPKPIWLGFLEILHDAVALCIGL